jgi:tRNA A-37 threonylcarbamoyl transferase component Bud32
VFEDIHRAGVRHQDPRVENLMIQDDGQVAVIDFDKAELGASERSKTREIDYLKDILDGLYRSRDGWPSEQTSRASDDEGFVGGSGQSESGSETE